MSSPTLSPIYDRLNGAGGYHPFTANTFADWSSEAGDTVTISRNGTDYTAPVHKQTITWRGQQRITMETGGNKEREATERVSDRKFRSNKSSARTSSGKTHTFEVNDQHLLYEIDNPTTGVMTRLQVAEGDIVAEVTRATTAEGGIQRDVSSLEVTIEGITQTVGTIESEVTTLDGKVTTIEGSALWTQRDNITGVVGEFDVVEDQSTHTKTLVVKAGGGLNIRRNNVEFGVYDDGTLTAGVIATKVNGVASTNIYADKILMSSASGAPTVQVTVNGKLDAAEFTAANINSLFSGAVGFTALSGDFTFLGADYLTVSEGTSAGTLSATSFSLANSDPFTDCIVNASVNSNTGVLTLTKASGDTVTFSKATTLTGAWSSGAFTATASPQGTTLTTSTTVGAVTWEGNTATVPIKATIGSSPTLYDVRDVTVNATPRYNAGWDYATTQVVVSGQTAGSSELPIKSLTYDEKWKVTFTIPDSSGTDHVSSYVLKAPSDLYATGWGAACAESVMPSAAGSGEATTFTLTAPNSTVDGAAVTKTFTMSKGTPGASGYASVSLAGVGVVGRIDISDWYTQGVADGEGEFSLASVTLQGGAISGTSYHTIPTGGTLYYTAGTAVTKYDKGSAETYYKGNGTRLGTVTRYPIGSTPTVYDKGSGVTYYQGNGQRYSAATRYTKGSKVYKRGDWVSPTYTGTQLYFAGGQSAGSGTWYLNSGNLYYSGPEIDSLGDSETVYIKNGSGDIYARGDAVTVYPATNGRSVNLIGTGETVYKASNTGSYYLRGDSVTVYQATNGASITPIGGTNLRLEQLTYAYGVGSTVTDTYYTKS